MSKNELISPSFSPANEYFASQKIRAHFNQAQNTYDDECVLQRKCGEKLINLTKQFLKDPKKIIDIGCGTGLITEKILQAFPFRNSYAIDFAEKLLIKAKARLNDKDVKIIEINFDDFFLADCDLLFSNLALHWSPCFEKTLQNLKKCLSNCGFLIFSIPLQNSLTFNFPFNTINFLEKNKVLKILNHTGFSLVYNDIANYSIKFNSGLLALHSIKKIGGHYYGQRKKFSSFAQRRLFLKEENAIHYNIGYFVVKKS